MNRVVNWPIALVISQWLPGVVHFILDQRNSFCQSALSWHVPVKFWNTEKWVCPPTISLQLMFLCDIYIYIYIGPSQSIEHGCLEYHYTKYIGPPQSIEHRGLAYCYTAYIYIYIYIYVLPSQFSIDALNTASPTARSRTMQIYSRQMGPP